MHSALSLPLLLPDDTVLGALSVYAHGRDMADAHAAAVAEAFSPHAAVSIHNTQLLDQVERLVGQLQTALASRAEIDQAIGIVMSRTGASATEAFDTLRAHSQTRSVKLTEVAHQILDQAVRRAGARHLASPDTDPLPEARPQP